ncbi:MAG: response regulator [Planctomycetia bacterium]|nr:response regulator [Planctomycetia bacterium]
MALVRVLVVDDDLLVLGLFRLILSSAGADVSTASGAAALPLLRDASFDLVLSDLQMPGISGVEVLEEARRRCPGAVRVLMSGDPAALEQGAGAGSPVELALAKPARSAALACPRAGAQGRPPRRRRRGDPEELLRGIGRRLRQGHGREVPAHECGRSIPAGAHSVRRRGAARRGDIRQADPSRGSPRV